MLCGGSRASVHLWDHRHPPPLGLGPFGAKVFRQASFLLRPCSAKLQQKMKSSSRSCCKNPGQIPVPHECFREKMMPSFHLKGFRQLQEASLLWGSLMRCISVIESLQFKLQELVLLIYCLLLESLKYSVGNLAPVEFEIAFVSVRHLSPQQFVEKISSEFRVCGVVAGENYRFGYRASGDASELIRLCKEYGISAYIINSIMDKNQVSRNADTEDDSKSKERGQVSSTRVRHALAVGDMRYVTELLGRPHRLISRVKTHVITSKGGTISLPSSSLLNLLPGNGVYEACSLIVGDELPITCNVVVDAWNLHIEREEVEEQRFCNSNGSQEFMLLGIEFG